MNSDEVSHVVLKAFDKNCLFPMTTKNLPSLFYKNLKSNPLNSNFK